VISVIRTILPESGDVLRATEKIHHFPGDILQIVPEADAVVGAIHSME
jgi:hypothetical protein